MKSAVVILSVLTLMVAFPASAVQTVSVEVLSTSTPPIIPPANSGGGGSTVTTQTGVSVSGRAFPLSKVSVLKDGALVLTTIAGPDARFSATISDLSSGTHTISVYGEDNRGIRTTLFSFPITVTSGALTSVSGIFLSPTIDVDKSEVKKGNPIAIFGRTTPSSAVAITIHSEQQLLKTARSGSDGVYLYYLDTTPLDLGDHTAQSLTATTTVVSPLSTKLGFVVGTKDVVKSPVAPTDCVKADVNCDGRVDLVDYSILSYWYKRSGSLPKHIDQDGNGIITLVDFSILAYYWTG